MTSQPSPIVRGLWLGVGSLVTVAALGFGTLQNVSLIAHDEAAEEATFSAGAVARLDVDSDNGSVEVVGADVDEITVTAEISIGLFGTGHRAEVVGSTLEVRADCPPFSTWCSVDYRIVVPRELPAVLRSNSDRITVRDLTGAVTVSSGNGPIELIDLEGRVEARTANGEIDAIGLRAPQVETRTRNGQIELLFAVPPVSVVASSSNGRIVVEVPDTDDTYRVEIDTGHGSRDVTIRTDPTSRRSIDVDTRNGDVSVRYPSG